MRRLIEIQQKLKANKDLYNSFGGYSYRSTETILEALKPLLQEYGLCILITDQLENIGDRYYVKATVKLYDIDGKIIAETSAYAREEESKKGMDGSQITGASSSYARKYALNGMFAIDDAKDSDTTNKHGKEEDNKNINPKTTIKPIDKTSDKKEVFITAKQKSELKEIINDRKIYAEIMNNALGKITVEKYEELIKEYGGNNAR